MKSRQIEYSSDMDAIMIRIPKGLSEGQPVQVGRHAPLLGRQDLGRVLRVIHHSAKAKKCSGSDS